MALFPGIWSGYSGSISTSRAWAEIWDFQWGQLRISLVDLNKQVFTDLVVDGYCVDFVDAVYDRGGQGVESRELLQRKARAQMALDRRLQAASLGRQFLDFELLMGMAALAHPHVHKEEKRKARHDEHRDAVGEPPTDCFLFD